MNRLRGLGLALGTLASASLYSCSDSGSGPPPPPGGVEAVDFASLEEMVAGSDVVLEGTIIGVEPGRIVGEADPIQFLQLTIRIEELLAGSTPTGAVETLLMEESTGSVEGPDNLEGVYGSSVGDHGVYFLGWKDSTPYYYLINSEGRFLEVDGRMVASNDLDDWAAELEQLTLEEFKTRVESAANETVA